MFCYQLRCHMNCGVADVTDVLRLIQDVISLTPRTLSFIVITVNPQLSQSPHCCHHHIYYHHLHIFIIIVSVPSSIIIRLTLSSGSCHHIRHYRQCHDYLFFLHQVQSLGWRLNHGRSHSWPTKMKTFASSQPGYVIQDNGKARGWKIRESDVDSCQKLEISAFCRTSRPALVSDRSSCSVGKLEASYCYSKAVEKSLRSHSVGKFD